MGPRGRLASPIRDRHDALDQGSVVARGGQMDWRGVSPRRRSAEGAGSSRMTAGALITAIVSATFLAAVISAGLSAIVTSVIARKKFLEEERARVRTIYADAFEAV